MRLRSATTADAEAILEIYNLEVLTSTVTFDLIPRTVDGQAAWLAERRQVQQDYLELFKDEAPGQVPAPLLAVVLGADSDNTASTSRGWFNQVQWQAAPSGDR